METGRLWFEPGELVHVHWIPSLEALPNRAGLEAIGREVLDADEKARLASLQWPEPRLRFQRSRLFLRRILSRYHPILPEAWQFSVGKHGAPSISPDILPAGARMEFNLAHTGEAVAVAVTPGWRVGVDVEEQVEFGTVSRSAARVLTDAELLDLGAAGDDTEVARRFTRYWTLKEAYLKALGCGLIVDPSTVAFERVGTNVRLVRSGADDPDPSRWIIQTKEFGRLHLAVAVASGCTGQSGIRWIKAGNEERWEGI
jgi:4'-phosphopantetheinyl transferase